MCSKWRFERSEDQQLLHCQRGKGSQVWCSPPLHQRGSGTPVWAKVPPTCMCRCCKCAKFSPLPFAAHWEPAFTLLLYTKEGRHTLAVTSNVLKEMVFKHNFSWYWYFLWVNSSSKFGLMRNLHILLPMVNHTEPLLCSTWDLRLHSWPARFSPAAMTWSCLFGLPLQLVKVKLSGCHEGNSPLHDVEENDFTSGYASWPWLSCAKVVLYSP